jgi:hypothetical protein
LRAGATHAALAAREIRVAELKTPSCSDLLYEPWERREPPQPLGIVILVDGISQLRRDPDRHADPAPRLTRSRRQQR